MTNRCAALVGWLRGDHFSAPQGNKEKRETNGKHAALISARVSDTQDWYPKASSAAFREFNNIHQHSTEMEAHQQ